MTSSTDLGLGIVRFIRELRKGRARFLNSWFRNRLFGFDTTGYFFEPLFHRWLKKQPPGTVFLDVGANIGYYVKLAVKRAALVVAFEPNPAIFRRLEELSSEKVRCFNIALGEDH